MQGMLKKLETMALAVAFAEAGDHEQARFYLKKKEKRVSRRLDLEKKQTQQVNQAQQDLRL